MAYAETHPPYNEAPVERSEIDGAAYSGPAPAEDVMAKINAEEAQNQTVYRRAQSVGAALQLFGHNNVRVGNPAEWVVEAAARIDAFLERGEVGSTTETVKQEVLNFKLPD
jgi:hypothetical protein